MKGNLSRDFNKGFSLLELTIVIAVLAIILYFAIPAYNKYRYKADMQTIIHSLEPFQAAVADVFAENQSPCFTTPLLLTQDFIQFPANGPVQSITTFNFDLVSNPGCAQTPYVVLFGKENAPVAGGHVRQLFIVYTAQVSSGTLNWQCSTDPLLFGYVPPNCQNSCAALGCTGWGVYQ